MPDEYLVSECWHVIEAAELKELMYRCYHGEDPEMVYIECYANAEDEEIE